MLERRSRRPGLLAFLLFTALLSLLALGGAGGLGIRRAAAMETVQFADGAETRTVTGKRVVEAQDGSILLLARDGRLWPIQETDIRRRFQDARPFEPLSRDELARRVLADLPDGFQVHDTNNYLIAYDTSREYAQWCGTLFERLYLAFNNYFRRRRFPVEEPEAPLVAIVFASRQSFIEHSRQEVGEAVAQIQGFYSLQSNRMTLYDLTGGRAGSGDIQRMLMRADMQRNIATVVHEAAHQIAYNNGLHQRWVDIPMWVSEGIATYFETPDLRGTRGWSTIGTINRDRLSQFRRYLPNRPDDSLESLIAEDSRFQNTETGPDAYAETWALTYFLLHRKPQQYLAYLQMLADKPPLVWDDAETRLAEFKQYFGDLSRLDAEFLRYISTLR